jgi:ABC-type nitrate/sulfonate/bicarbonate transport system permease component
MRRAISRTALPLITLGVVIFTWWAVLRGLHMEAYLLPGPDAFA